MIWPIRRRTRRKSALWPVAGQYLSRERAFKTMVEIGYCWRIWSPGAKPLFLLYHPDRKDFLTYLVGLEDKEEFSKVGGREGIGPERPKVGRVFIDDLDGAPVPPDIPDTLGLSEV